MEKNLVIDIGNTRIKCALFENGTLSELMFFDALDYEAVKIFIASLDVEYCILATTQLENKDFVLFLQHKFNTINFTSKTPLPINLSYQTPDTLGDDRKAVVVGAIAQVGRVPLLVITTGTCITYNYYDGKSLVGGGISPGLKIRYKAMHDYTGLLPLVEDESFESLIGTTTQESLLSGARQGILAEVDGIISKYKLLNKKIKVFISGGDTNFFESRLKNEIFASPNLVLYGLNHILEYNKTT